MVEAQQLCLGAAEVEEAAVDAKKEAAPAEADETETWRSGIRISTRARLPSNTAGQRRPSREWTSNGDDSVSSEWHKQVSEALNNNSALTERRRRSCGGE